MNTTPFLKTAANAGIVLGLALVAIAHAGYLWGQLGTASWVGYLNWVAFFMCPYFFIKHFRVKYNDNTLSYFQGLRMGILISLFASFLYAFYFYFLIKIDPNYMNQVMQVAADTMVQGGISEKEVSKMMEMSEEAMTPWTILFSSMFSMGLIGFFFSVIVAAFTRKKQPIF